MYSKAILQRKIQTNTYLVGPFPLYYITILLYYYDLHIHRKYLPNYPS